MQALASCESTGDSVDTYLLNCDKSPLYNIKIRDGKLELKKLKERYQGLERWEPAGQWCFPVSFNTLESLWANTDVVLERAQNRAETFSCYELINIVGESEHLRCVNIHKRRYRFALKGCDAEMDRLLVRGHTLESCAVESGDPQAILDMLDDLQLTGAVNCSYPRLLCQGAGLQW